MSSTITETERRTVPKISQPEISPEILKKRENFARSGSIEKLKKFNNFICSQHYYILPSLLMWLKTSQTVLTSSMEKCIVYIKAMFLLSTVQCLQEKTDNSFAAFFKLSTKDVLPILTILLIKTNELLVLLYDEIKRIILVSTIYLAICLVFCQLIGLIGLIFFKIPPVGFVFLIGCVLFMSRIAVIIMLKTTEKEVKNDSVKNDIVKTKEEKKLIRKQLSYIGKTISNVKLL